jgi:hypothetical protein
MNKWTTDKEKVSPVIQSNWTGHKVAAKEDFRDRDQAMLAASWECLELMWGSVGGVGGGNRRSRRHHSPIACWIDM